jgi:hypothetical protein
VLAYALFFVEINASNMLAVRNASTVVCHGVIKGGEENSVPLPFMLRTDETLPSLPLIFPQLVGPQVVK